MAGAVCALAALGLAAWWGYQWQRHLKVERIEVTGVHHAEPGALVELAGVDTTMRLFGLDPALVADRVERHPWVRRAEVTRRPTGTLAIHVTGRTPLVLALDANGTPARDLDARGFQVPADSGVVYDVPLLRGLDEPYHPMRRLQGEDARALLEALSALNDTLVSEIERRPDGEWWLYTAPTDVRGVTPVRLGHAPFAPKLRRLRAFWRQAVRTQPATRFEVIDVRFDGQVVTRETDRKMQDSQPAT